MDFWKLKKFYFQRPLWKPFACKNWKCLSLNWTAILKKTRLLKTTTMLSLLIFGLLNLQRTHICKSVFNFFLKALIYWIAHFWWNVFQFHTLLLIFAKDYSHFLKNLKWIQTKCVLQVTVALTSNQLCQLWPGFPVHAIAWVLLLIQLGKITYKSENALDFWKSVTKFPILSSVAFEILVVPCSSSLSERQFSVTGKFNRPDRSSMTPTTLSMLTKLSSFLKLKI